MHLSSKPNSVTLLGHPVGLFILFLTEMWERFSFYGMRALLVLFLIDKVKGGLGWSEAAALKLYGVNLLMVYALGIPGGFLADRYLGQRAAVIWGGVLQCIGHFLLALNNEAVFMVGLGLIAMGTGLLKPNISAMVGGLYEQGDVRRDGGFTIFYMGINIGAVLSSLVVGFVGEVYGWHYGFSLAGFGMLIGLIIFLAGRKYLGDVGQRPQRKKKEKVVGNVSKTKAFTQEEKERLFVLGVSLLAIFTFFAAFEQAGGSMNLYTEKHTDRFVLGWEVPASIFQALNPAFVILLGPVVALIWSKLAQRHQHISSIYKIGVGNIIVGIGFLFMVGAVLHHQSSPTAHSALHWLINAYLFHTIGELCLSPVSLSFITKVAPERIKSSMMGIYFAAIGAACWLGGQIGALDYLTTFTMLVCLTVLLGLLCIIFNKRLMTLTHGCE
ncbi:MAG: peptide MFS transporter [Roseivirga sp.]